MTSPQSDPVGESGVPAAIARLTEGAIGHLRRIDNLEKHQQEQMQMLERLLRADILALRELMQSELARYRGMIDGVDSRAALALAGQRDATRKEEAASADRFNDVYARFATVNKFREQLDDQARNLMPRTEATQLAGQATEGLRAVRDQLATLMPRAEADARNERYGERLEDMRARVEKGVSRDELEAVIRREEERYTDIRDQLVAQQAQLARVNTLTDSAKEAQRILFAKLAAVVSIVGVLLALTVFGVNLALR